MLFPYLLKRIIHKGTLRLITADEKNYVMGTGLPYVAVKLHRKSLEWTAGLRPDLKIGEAYMDGLLTIEEGTLRDFLYLLLSNYRDVKNQPLFQWHERLTRRAGLFYQVNTLRRARNNVAYHYDLPDQLYNFFLDSDRQYSCAYFTDPDNSLEQAQLDKKRHLASKLLLDKPALKVLDIGSGWGGMGIYLAQECDCDVTGVTLSVKQYTTSRERVRATGLDKVCHFKLQDYRQEHDRYDRIISVGMFEHVGKKNYGEFFAHIYKLLADDGVCLLHTIARFDKPQPTNAFINKYIFPGAAVPALSEIMEVVQSSGLYVTDIEILRLHYAETLKRWTSRFQHHATEVISLYGAPFYRRWLFYLISCEMGFRFEDLMVAQIQLSRKLETVPPTRDYMHQWEEAHQAEASPPLRQKMSSIGDHA